MMHLALYHGPATDWVHKLSHLAIRARFLSAYSHSEMVIGGLDARGRGQCFGASVRDGGVRDKRIDLGTGRWSLYPLPGADEGLARARFAERDGEPYDWRGAARWVLPVVGQSARRSYCFELSAAMLGLPNPHKATPHHLVAHALALAGRHFDQPTTYYPPGADPDVV